MDEPDYMVVLFDSTSLAIRGEQVAKKAGFLVRCIPTPRHISSDCGIVLRIRPEDREGILRKYETNKVRHNGVVELRPVQL